MSETQIHETQISNQVKVEIKGELRRYPVVYLNHERPIYGYTSPVLLRFGNEWWVGFLPPRFVESAEFAIHELKQAFYVIPIERELSSNSGAHKVLYHLSSPLDMLPRSDYNPVALYTIEKIYKFPRGARPNPESLEILKKQYKYYIAWTVREGIDVLWILRYETYNYGIDIRIEGIESMEQLIRSMEYLQGNLRYMKVSDITMGDVYYERFEIYGHAIEPADRRSFINMLPVSVKIVTDYEKTVGILAFLKVDDDSKAIVRHEEHGEITLEPGYYILWHRKPIPEKVD